MTLPAYGADNLAMASDDKSSARFQQQPLNDPESQIRLVKLLPESNNGAIQCSLRHAKLDSKYVALSYVWGPPTPTRDILIDGETFTIRENLWQFLARECQKRRSHQSYWIDQICIKQHDTTEKSHQVNVIGRNLHERGESVRLAWDHLTDDSDRRRHLLYGLEHNSYWARAWTAQEFFLARDLKIISGKCEMSLEPFDRAYHSADPDMVPGVPVDRGVDRTAATVYLWGTQQQWGRTRHRNKNLGSQTTLSDLLVRFGESARDCERPIDSIYSLLGLVERECLVKPDYSKDPSTLHREVFVYEWDLIQNPWHFSYQIALNIKLDSDRARQALWEYLGLRKHDRSEEAMFKAVLEARALLASGNGTSATVIAASDSHHPDSDSSLNES